MKLNLTIVNTITRDDALSDPVIDTQVYPNKAAARKALASALLRLKTELIDEGFEDDLDDLIEVHKDGTYTYIPCRGDAWVHKTEIVKRTI